MVNSVHSAKWLAQFQDSEIDFYIFPSTYFRSVHPLLKSLIQSKTTANFNFQFTKFNAGWFDYLQERVLLNLLPYFSRKKRLHRYLKRSKPEIVHAMEFQHSAYLCAEVIDSFGKDFQLIATNWGSDIYHFMNFREHYFQIKNVLQLADKYSAECSRDYELATKLGFTGVFLPIIPNSGGFKLEDISRLRSTASSRKQIVIKGYGGYFGRVSLVIQAMERILLDFPDYSLFFYSVTEDVVELVQDLESRFKPRIKFSTLRIPLNYADLQEIFSESRIYIGCSISDGVSTSFLESLVSGAYPIQTKTSCADEWISKGAMGSLINLNINELIEAIEFALKNDDLVDMAQRVNSDIVKSRLDSHIIFNQAKTFYA
jgi:glycosyltransferase involved in cell wall biosynthesis